MRYRLLCAFSLLALLWCLAHATSCRKDPAAPPAEDAAERARKASVLFREAQAAPIPEKYDRFRRLIALYDDTPSGQSGYLDLIVYLTRDRPPQTAEALKYARAFRDRHPTDPRVSEGFRQVADTAYGQKDDATHKAVLADLEKFLIERDVADDVPKPALLMDFVGLRLRQERWEDSEVAIDTALGDAGVSKVEKVELLVRKGSILAEKLGKKDEARRAFEQALALAREVHATETVRPGIPPAQIEEELRKLEG
jgi:hypothetical protein